MYDKIKAWLSKENKDYSKGLDLFNKVSKNRAMYLYLSRKQDLKKLVYELEKILQYFPKEKLAKIESATNSDETKKPVIPAGENLKPVNSEKTEEEQSEATLILSQKKVKPEDLPSELKAVYDSVVGKYKTQRALHEKMKLPELTDEQRSEVRAEVVQLDDKISEGWASIDAWIENPNPQSTDKGEDKHNDPIAISKEINAARKYISVNLPKLSSLKGEALKVVRLKLQERYNTLVNLKAEISPDTIDGLKNAGLLSL